MKAIMTAALLSAAVQWTAPAVASGEEGCLLSFEAARFDACTQRSVGANGPLSALAGQTRAGEHSYWVLKFDAPLDRSQRQAIEAAGGQILDYLPWNAYRVRFGADARPAEAVRGLVWSGAMAPDWKLAGGLSGLLGAPLEDRPAAVPLSIALNAGANAHALLAQWRELDGVAHGFTVTGARSDRVVLTLASRDLEAVVSAIAPRADVAAITVRKRMEYLNARAGWLHQSGTPDERPVFDQGLLGCGQVIGVLDSGVDFSHCAFEDTANGDPPVSDCNEGDLCLPGAPDFLQRKTAHYYKWSDSGDALGDGACDASTGAGHGTHVAASITGNDWAAAVDCEAGAAPPAGNLNGTAPGAHLIAQEMGEGLDYVNSLGGSIYHAATTAYANGARVHSNSWGGSCCFLGLFCLPTFLCAPAYDEFAHDADAATWEFPDLLIAIAAGNNGTCCASSGGAVGSPGLAKNALTVGASGAGTAGNDAASFSSRGPIFDNRTKPDVMAQGEGIVSAASDGNAAGSSCATCTMSGTSMATPTAAGLAALVREYLNRGFHPSGAASSGDAIAQPSAALVKAMIINGARDMSGSGATGAVPNQVEGWGRIHLDDVLYFAGDARRTWLHDDTDGVETGQVKDHTLTVGSDSQALKVTLVWSDYPAAVSANPHIVNRLRLEVEAPDGGVWTQKLPASGTPDPFADTATSGYDERNTVHQIVFPSPAPGDYRVRVRGVAVAQGKPGQPYAVVATGDLHVETGKPAEVDLSITKTADVEEIEPGGAFAYTLQVESDGDGAGNVVVSDAIPEGVCVTAIDAGAWDCGISAGVLVCTLPSALAGPADAIVLSVLAPEAKGELVNTASVTSSTADPDPANNSGSVSVLVVADKDDTLFADGFEEAATPACL